MQSLLVYVQTLIYLPFLIRNRNQVLTYKLISCQHYSIILIQNTYILLTERQSLMANNDNS